LRAERVDLVLRENLTVRARLSDVLLLEVREVGDNLSRCQAATLIPDTVPPSSLVRRAVPGSRDLASKTHGPYGPRVGRTVSTRWSRRCVDGRASHDADRLASTRVPACGGRTWGQVCRHRVPCSEW